MDDELKAKLWLMPVPFMALIGVMIGLMLMTKFYVNGWISLTIGMFVGAILMMPFMFKYSEKIKVVEG